MNTTTTLIVCLAIGGRETRKYGGELFNPYTQTNVCKLCFVFRVYIRQQSITVLLVQLADVQFMSGSLCPWHVCLLLKYMIIGITWLCTIYHSDKPGNHNFDLLKKLVLPDGSVLRAQLPGRPTRDSLFNDPARDGTRFVVNSLIWHCCLFYSPLIVDCCW